jgi:osmoprotectant transport system ATP-binding protein
MLRLTGISKRYEDELALRDVSLEFPSGETTVLIGPSGCGKSTLLRIIVGLVTPDAGGVELDGRVLHPARMLEERRAMGYVIQEGGLFPHLTARGNVTLAAETFGWSRERMDGRVAELCRLTHMPEELMARYPIQLSGGQRQRVSLMRALMLDPELLLLDEPLGALDPMIRADLQQDLREIFRSLRKTVVMVTHDMGEAAFFGDTIVMMREGGVVQAGTLGELMKRPSDPFVTQFISAQRSPLDSAEPPGSAGAEAAK